MSGKSGSTLSMTAQSTKRNRIPGIHSSESPGLRSSSSSDEYIISQLSLSCLLRFFCFTPILLPSHSPSDKNILSQTAAACLGSFGFIWGQLFQKPGCSLPKPPKQLLFFFCVFFCILTLTLILILIGSICLICYSLFVPYFSC